MLDPWPAESTGAALKILGTVAMEDNYKVMHGFLMPLTVVLFKDQLHNYIMDRKINECSQDT